MIYIWLGIIILSLIAEAMTVQMIAIWFAPAALVSLILELLGVPEAVQLFVFIGVSALCLVLFYKKMRKLIADKAEKTNVDALIGEIGFVEEEIRQYNPGRIKVKGMSWNAESDTTLNVGDMVKVLGVSGVTVKCEKTEK